MGQIAKVAAASAGQMQKARPDQQMRDMMTAAWPKIQAVMPKHMSGERLYQLAITAYNSTPKLMDCSPASVLSCVMKCAALGLEPSAVDGLGRAYILPYWNGKTRHYEAQFMLGYKGMIDLARRSGELKSIHAQAVYEADEFSKWEDETGQHFRFEPARDADHSPDKLTDVYVCAQLKDGGFVFESMTKAEVDAIRNRSKSKDRGPWVTDYEAMALKTVIRRSFRYLPVSVEAQSAAAADETTPDYGSLLKPVVPAPENVDAETGEVLEPDVQEVPATAAEEPAEAQEAEVPKSGRKAAPEAEKPDQKASETPEVYAEDVNF